jgi:acyl carrier protein
MTDEEIYAGLTDVFHEVFGNDAISLTPETTAEQVEGWDSIKMVTIILGVEQKFSIRLRSRDVDNLKKVGDLASLIKVKSN